MRGAVSIHLCIHPYGRTFASIGPQGRWFATCGSHGSISGISAPKGASLEYQIAVQWRRFFLVGTKVRGDIGRRIPESNQSGRDDMSVGRSVGRRCSDLLRGEAAEKEGRKEGQAACPSVGWGQHYLYGGIHRTSSALRGGGQKELDFVAL